MANPIIPTGYVSDEAAIMTNNNAGITEGNSSSNSNDDGEDPTGRTRSSGSTPETAEMFVPRKSAKQRRYTDRSFGEPRARAFQSTPGAHLVDVNEYPQMNER